MIRDKKIVKSIVVAVFTVVILISTPSYSKSGPPKLSNSEFKEKFEVAMEYYAYQYYSEALTEFQALLSTETNNCNLNFYVGNCILNLMGKRSLSIPYFEKAIKKTNVSYSASHREENAPVHAFYFLAQAYLIDNRYDDANKMYEKFKTFLGPKDEKAKEDLIWQMKVAENAKSFATNIQKNIQIEPFNDVNSTASDITPILNNEGTVFYFSSMRKTNGEKDNFGQCPADIYFMEQKAGKWTKAKKLAGKINTDKADELCSLSYDGKRMYFQRMSSSGTFDIYCSTIGKKGKWQAPSKMSAAINSKFNEECAFESKDGMKLYFVSDRDGGFGGKDIWVCEKDSKGDWGIPRNLGSSINTKFDETSPFLLKDDVTLYFSSKGHDTMGGYDIFISTISDDGLWSNPENMGCPLNTTSDDVYYKESIDGRSAFYSTSKKGGWGELDIFKVTFK